MMGKAGLILTQGFADWEYAFIAGTGAAFYGIDVRFFTPTPNTLRSQGGLETKVNDDLQACLEWKPDVVVVIGGLSWQRSDAPDISSFLQACRNNGSVLAGICGGTLALARAGLLNTVTHTSNEEDFLLKNAPAYSGKEYYKPSSVAVVDDKIITAPGIAPVTFTSKIFEAAGLAPDIARQFQSMLAQEHR